MQARAYRPRPEADAPSEVSDASVGLRTARYLGAAMASDFRQPFNAVCVTVYNEPLEKVHATLSSLALALRAWTEEGTQRGHVNAICLVIDGIDRADPALLMFLHERGYITDVIADMSRREPGQTTPFFSLHGIDEWTEAQPHVVASAEPLRFIVCVKHHNSGKLHSHALFFGALCEQFEPTVCYQIDAGTVVEAQAIGAIVEHLQRLPAVGALATRVGCAVPAPGDSLLLRWQYMDFATQLATHWPAEVMSGHLSVIPGQFCAFRWDALKNRPRDREAKVGAPGVRADSPMSRYLRGMAPASAMERIMFLAEDRVIGNEIVLAPHQSWRLDYCREAIATTDACDTLGELQRQRRRWNNCSFACRVWLLRQWPALMQRRDRGLRDKARISISMLWQIVLSLLQAAAPASALCVTLAAWGAVLSAWRIGHTLLPLATLGAILLSLPLMLYTPRLAPTLMRVYALMRDVMTAAALALLATTASLTLPWQGMLLLFLPAAASAALPVVNAPSRPMQVLRHLPEFLSVNAVLQVMLWAYAMARLQDTSWGTKGLHSAQPCAAAAKSMRRYRNRVIASWGLLNAALIGVGLACPGRWVASLNPVAEGIGLVTALATLMAAIGLALRAGTRWWQGWQRRAAAPASDAARPAKNNVPLLVD